MTATARGRTARDVTSALDLRDFVLDVPDFPKAGITFKDITPLLRDPRALHACADALAAPFRDVPVDAVLCLDARGFLFGPLVAARLGVGVVPARKPGKLPRATVQAKYALEYGDNTLEVHRDAFRPGERVLLVDDVLATGGTARAAADLARGLGAELIGSAFVLELLGLGGRAKLEGPVHAVLPY